MSRLFVPLKRTTLHIPNTGSASNPDVGHLHVIVNDPCPAKKNLLVSISSAYPRCDRTCILNSGHKFIRHESFAFYAKADVVDSDLLMKSVSENVVKYEGLFDEDEFTLLCEGIENSPHTKPIVLKYYQDFCK